MNDFVTLREVMVDTQIRPSDVTKFPILDAMLKIPREHFVPRDKRDVAYIGESVPLGADRVVMDPRTLAKLLDALDITQSELVLDIGSGLGYSSALLSRLAEAVVAVEDDETRVADSEEVLQEMGLDNIFLLQGALNEGAAQHGPYDVILIQGAVEDIPQSLIDQLKEGGRMGAIFRDRMNGEARIGFKRDGRMTWRFVFNATLPVLGEFRKAKKFTL